MILAAVAPVIFALSAGNVGSDEFDEEDLDRWQEQFMQVVDEGARPVDRRREDDRAHRLRSLRTARRRAGFRQALAGNEGVPPSEGWKPSLAWNNPGNEGILPSSRARRPRSQRVPFAPAQRRPLRKLPGEKMPFLPGLRHNPPGTPQRCARSSVDRASVSGTEGQGFESLRARHLQQGPFRVHGLQIIPET